MPKASPAVAVPSTPPRVGRPALPLEEIDARVAGYCARYGVAAVEGLPPFPAGQRETRQHREWLALYKARQRHSRRVSAAAAASTSSAACGVCAKPVEAGGEAEAYARPGERRTRTLHRACAALARAGEAAGPDAVAGLARFIRHDRPR